MRKLLKRQGFAPATIVTDKLGSYGAAKKKLGLHAGSTLRLRQHEIVLDLPELASKP
jgi:putative transposase